MRHIALAFVFITLLTFIAAGFMLGWPKEALSFAGFGAALAMFGMIE